MKRIIKNNLLGFILGIIISGVGVYAVNYAASTINYTTTKNSEVKTVKDALDDLYVKANNKCVKGKINKSANSNIEIDFPIKPTSFLLTFNTDNTIWNIFYNKNISENFYMSLNGLNNGYNSSGLKNDISTLSDNKYIYNADTNWTEYKNEYQISYIACE